LVIFPDRPNITEEPVSVTVDQYENATFNCTATGPGDLKIVWTCSDGSNCGISSTNRNNDGSLTSTLVITRATSNLTVTCYVIQNLTRLSSSEPANVEVRLPSIETVPLSTAELTVIPISTTTQPTDPLTEGPQSPAGELK
jgi:hypothetical protein